MARQLTVGIADEHDRSGRGQDAIELARDDQSLESRSQAHPVNIGSRQTIGQDLPRLVREEAEIREALLGDGFAQLVHATAAADHEEHQIGFRPKHPRCAEQRVKFVRPAEIPRIADDELTAEAEPPPQLAGRGPAWAAADPARPSSR